MLFYIEVKNFHDVVSIHEKEYYSTSPKGHLSARHKKALRQLFHKFVTSTGDILSASLSSLKERLEKTKESNAFLEQVVLRIMNEYPGDVGGLAPYLLNTIKLLPGESIFLGANEPHAYLAGDIVEVMACSDNVVRAGLTPKMRDVPTLLDMLTYTSYKVDPHRGEVVNPNLTVFIPPVEEFVVEKYQLMGHEKGIKTRNVNLPCILLTVSGSGEARTTSGEIFKLLPGYSYFTEAGLDVCLDSNDDDGLTLYRVHSNIYI